MPLRRLPLRTWLLASTFAIVGISPAVPASAFFIAGNAANGHPSARASDNSLIVLASGRREDRVNRREDRQEDRLERREDRHAR